MTRKTALKRITNILTHAGYGSTFGHSFRISGATIFLARGVNPEIVRLTGRWRSLAYESYIRAFEHAASVHLANIESRSVAQLASSLDWGAASAPR